MMDRSRRSGTRQADSSMVGIQPGSLQVETDCVRAGDGWAATLVVTGYPAEVTGGWLEPLLGWPGRLDVALRVVPVPAETAAGRLRKQRARLESVRRHRARHDRLDDPDLDAAADDAADLAGRVARGAGRLFTVALALTVHASTRGQLRADVADVRALAASMMLTAHPATWRAVQGYVTTLPLGLDLLGATRTLDTDALAAAFPFTSPDLPATDPTRPGHLGHGVFAGLNAGSAGLAVPDRWAQPNYNSVVLAASGAGKSYAAKLVDVLHPLYQGVQVRVVDPENEYLRLAEAIGGTVVNLGDAGTRLNPLDLPAEAPADSDAYVRRSLFLHTLIAVLLGNELDPATRAALDRAVLGAYHAAGISAEPRTWARPAPLLRDVRAQLAADEDPAGAELARTLTPFTDGSFSHLFAGPTTRDPSGHLVVYALKTVPDELRTAATVLALDSIWRQVSDTRDRRRRIVVVDEGWQLLQHEHGAQFLCRLAKSARKHWCGLTVVTQDTEDVLASRLGRAVVSNSATRLLLAQSADTIDAAADAFDLTNGEARWLLTAQPGHGLLIHGRDRIAVQILASDIEADLIRTDPEFLATVEPSTTHMEAVR